MSPQDRPRGPGGYPPGVALNGGGGDVTLRMDVVTARAVWHAIGMGVQIMDEVDVPPHAPLYGQRERLIAAARRLDHEINHA